MVFREEINTCKKLIESLSCSDDVPSVLRCKQEKDKLSRCKKKIMNWQQKTMCYCLRSGDKNTRFFHISTIAMHKIKIVSRDCEVMMWNGAKMI